MCFPYALKFNAVLSPLVPFTETHQSYSHNTVKICILAIQPDTVNLESTLNTLMRGNKTVLLDRYEMLCSVHDCGHQTVRILFAYLPHQKIYPLDLPSNLVTRVTTNALKRKKLVQFIFHRFQLQSPPTWQLSFLLYLALNHP